jgi:hypothetical protein
MKGELGLWDVERNPKPESLEEYEKQEIMGANGRSQDRGILQPEP